MTVKPLEHETDLTAVPECTFINGWSDRRQTRVVPAAAPMTNVSSRRALLRAAFALSGAMLSGRTGAQTAGRTVRDGAGRSVLLPGPVRRVLPAGPPASILLWSLAPDLMTGWVRRPSPAELAFLPPEAAALPEAGRLTGRDNTANVEAVLAQRPDLVLDYGSLGATYVSLADRVQAQTGLPDLLLDGTLARIPETYALLGEILDRREAAAVRADAARNVLAEAQAAADLLRSKGRPSVYYARGPRGVETGLTGSINTEILEFAGAENVAARSLGAGGLAQVSAEQVLAWDPDWIIAADPRFFAGAPADPVWSTLRAVRAGRIVLAPGVPYGWIDAPPSVNRLLGLVWLPVLFGAQPADTLEARLTDLYGLLFGRRPGPAQLAPLLRDAMPRR